jgi:iron-sulfur cluster assembly accessory protein
LSIHNIEYLIVLAFSKPAAMSLQRALVPATSSATFFKALAIASTSRACPHTFRSLSSSTQRRQYSKRELYTAPAYQPHAFPDAFPPPRNTGIPDTSIAGPKPEVNDTRPPRASGRYGTGQTADLEESASISVPEREAQKSKPVAPPKPAASTAPEPKPRRSKLKARKAAMSITPSALIHLKELLDQPEPKMIRVGVKNRGCSGLAYHLEYVDKPGAFDEVVEKEGVKVLIDSKALFSIIGSEMDWQEDTLSTRFIFKNPNIKEQCGCGESFMV